MIKYGEINQALQRYTRVDIHDNIPVEYYRRIMKAWLRATNKGHCWDVQQAAAILLYIAFNENVIHPSQLNADGLSTLDWAERFLEQIQENAGKEVIRALSAA